MLLNVFWLFSSPQLNIAIFFPNVFESLQKLCLQYDFSNYRFKFSQDCEAIMYSDPQSELLVFLQLYASAIWQVNYTFVFLFIKLAFTCMIHCLFPLEGLCFHCILRFVSSYFVIFFHLLQGLTLLSLCFFFPQSCNIFMKFYILQD